MRAIFQKILAFFMTILAFFGIHIGGHEQPATTVDDNAGYTAEADTVEFALAGNATTGYSWHVEMAGDALELTKENYVSDPAAPGMAGVGGTQYYGFKAVAPGTAVLTFSYFRDWEEDPPVSTYIATVTVAADLTVSVDSFVEG